MFLLSWLEALPKLLVNRTGGVVQQARSVIVRLGEIPQELPQAPMTAFSTKAI